MPRKTAVLKDPECSQTNLEGCSKAWLNFEVYCQAAKITPEARKKGSLFSLDRDAKKSKISERPAEFTVHSRDNSKNFLLKIFKEILQNVHVHQQYKQ